MKSMVWDRVGIVIMVWERMGDFQVFFLVGSTFLRGSSLSFSLSVFLSLSLSHVFRSVFVDYETIKRELNKRLTHKCRCYERLKDKDEGST